MEWFLVAFQKLKCVKKIIFTLFVKCVIDTYHHCIWLYNEPDDEPELLIAKEGIDKCYDKYHNRVELAGRLSRWYNKHIKKH